MANSLKLVLCFLAMAIKLSSQTNSANRMILTGVDCPKDFENVMCHNVLCETQHVKDENPKITVGCEAVDVATDVSVRSIEYYKGGSSQKGFLFSSTTNSSSRTLPRNTAPFTSPMSRTFARACAP
jgi:hypothetical protein